MTDTNTPTHADWSAEVETRDGARAQAVLFLLEYRDRLAAGDGSGAETALSLAVNLATQAEAAAARAQVLSHLLQELGR